MPDSTDQRRHHYLSIDDWVCHRHNAKLMLFQGMAKCPVITCMGWISASDVKKLQGTVSRYAVTTDGQVLRNIYHVNAGQSLAVTGEEIAPGVLLPAIDYDDPDLVQYWHMFGVEFSVPNIVMTAGENGPIIPGPIFGSIYVTVVAGPLLTPPHGIFASTELRVKDGIDVLRDGISCHLDLLCTWTHAPNVEEMREAESGQVAAQYRKNGCPPQMHRLIMSNGVGD